VHLILGTTGFGRGKSLPAMPQMPIQNIDKKTHEKLICLSSNAWRREPHAHDQNDELESLKVQDEMRTKQGQGLPNPKWCLAPFAKSD